MRYKGFKCKKQKSNIDKDYTKYSLYKRINDRFICGLRFFKNTEIVPKNIWEQIYQEITNDYK